MSWCRWLWLLLVGADCLADGGYIVGGGAELDSADGIAATVFGSVATGENTWLSGGVANGVVDAPARERVETWYADASLDHYFDPVGVRVGAAYWLGDDTLESNDWRASLYWRGDKASLSADYEYRDMQLTLPIFDVLPRRDGSFDANGTGATARFDIGESADISLSGISYDYSIDLRLDPVRGIADYYTASRLGLVNTLVDYRAGAGLGFDMGLHRLELGVSQWRGAVGGNTTRSWTLAWLAPLTARSDIELALGYDDSESYGDVTVISVFVYFYGGG